MLDVELEVVVKVDDELLLELDVVVDVVLRQLSPSSKYRWRSRPVSVARDPDAEMKHRSFSVLKWKARHLTFFVRHALAHAAIVVASSTRSASMTLKLGTGSLKLYSGPNGHGGSGVIVLELVEVEVELLVLVLDVVVRHSKARW